MKKLCIVYVLVIIIIQHTTGSHVYASISEITQLYNKHNLTRYKDLQDPVSCFRALKEMFLLDIVDKNDLLGAIVGLIKIKKHLNHNEVLEKDDIEFFDIVEDFMEEMELEDKTAIDFELGN